MEIPAHLKPAYEQVKKTKGKKEADRQLKVLLDKGGE